MGVSGCLALARKRKYLNLVRSSHCLHIIRLRVEGTSVSLNVRAEVNFLGTYHWADPTAISKDNKTIYYPAGNGRIGFFTISDEEDEKPTFGFVYDKFSKNLYLRVVV